MMSEHKKMGRPKKDDAKTKPVQVRFSDAEFDMIKMSAQNCNMTITEFVRKGAVDLANKAK